MWRLLTFEEIQDQLRTINKKVNYIMATMKDIQDAVSAQTSVEQSVLSMLQNLVQQLKDAQASNDPAVMDQVVQNIQANTKMLSDAVAANTPAQTTPSQASTPVVPSTPAADAATTSPVVTAPQS